jgi:hypothetical protein
MPCPASGSELKVLNSSIVVPRRVTMQYWIEVSDGGLGDVDAVTAGISGGGGLVIGGRYIIDFSSKSSLRKFADGQPWSW